MSLPKIIVMADHGRERALNTVRKILETVEGKAVVERNIDLRTNEHVDCSADLAFVVGGDGTMLHAGRLLINSGIPAVGVNIGKLGFLTQFTPEEIPENIDGLLAGEFPVEERIVLNGTLRRTNGVGENFVAVNDFVVSRGAGIRMIETEATLGGEKITTYRGDGLIISTPAGSTAHSLSAGGPILTPKMRALVITPICPHTLTVRPLVVSANLEIEIELISGEEKYANISVDGQEVVNIRIGDRFTVKRGHRMRRVVMRRGKSFFKTLTSKLNWGGHTNYGKDES